jgi:hypothetical protein
VHLGESTFCSFLLYSHFSHIFYLQTEIRGEELTNYVQQLTAVQRSFNELSVLSKKRLRDLETLLDFIQSTTTELIWLNEKEEIETSRDWSSKSLDVAETERYHEVSSSPFYTGMASFRVNIKDCRIIPLK